MTFDFSPFPGFCQDYSRIFPGIVFAFARAKNVYVA